VARSFEVDRCEEQLWSLAFECLWPFRQRTGKAERRRRLARLLPSIPTNISPSKECT
jgi:hypothetical protein